MTGHRTHAIVSRLISIKLWMSVIGIAAVWILGEDLDVEQKTQISGALTALFVLVQGFVDGLQGTRPTE